MTDIEMGPEIEIEGQRPEWLEDDELIAIGWNSPGLKYQGQWGGLSTPASRVHGWDKSIESIRLRADHPFYRTRPTEPADDSDYVRVRKMTEAEWRNLWGFPGCQTADTFVDRMRQLGLIREETLLEQFRRDYDKPLLFSGRKVAQAAIEWMQEKQK